MCVGKDGHVFQKAAHIAGPVESPLGTLEDFDALQVTRINVRNHHIAAGEGSARADRRVVDIDSNGWRIAIARRYPANHKFLKAVAVIVKRQSRHASKVVIQAQFVVRDQGVRVEHCCGFRHVLQALGAFLGRNDDLR